MQEFITYVNYSKTTHCKHQIQLELRLIGNMKNIISYICLVGFKR